MIGHSTRMMTLARLMIVAALLAAAFGQAPSGVGGL